MAMLKIQMDTKRAESAFRRVDRQMPKDFRLGLRETAKFGRRIAKELVPVRDGDLKASIGFRTTGKLEVTLFASEHYASYVEYGTSKMAEQPYMTPAIEASDGELRRQMRIVLDKAANNFKR